MSEVLAAARDRFVSRNLLYRSYGYDRPAAAQSAVDRLGACEEPVLDVGTGQGLLAIELARRGHQVVSIDLSAEEQQVGVVNAQHEAVWHRITFLAVDARDTRLESASFGAIGMMDALHHLDDGPATFAEMARLLRPGGRILLAELTAEGFALVARVHESEGRVHPVAGVTLAAAADWFTSNGFRLSALDEAHLHAVAILDKAAR
jgi:2-polyprenyl-3-methyl-5-hydroxy-6-metoxy-1,4-benzoquinol methylase